MKEDTGRERREATNRKEEEETGNGRLDKERRQKRDKETPGRTRREGGGVNSELWLHLVTAEDTNERRCRTRGRRAA